MFLKDILFHCVDEDTFKMFLKAVSAWTFVISAPLFYHQLSMLRPGFFWYPVFLLLLLGATSFLLAFVAGRDIPCNSPRIDQRVFCAVASYSAAFFPVWLATFGPEVMGRNAWRGNVLLINIITGLMGLSGGVWAALALRWLRPGAFSARPLGKIAAGGIALQFFWIVSTHVQAIPSLRTIVHALTQGGWHEYTCYFFWEALFMSVFWPGGLAGGLLLYISMEKIFKDDKGGHKFKRQATPSWWD